jgi:hypothetical protein
MSIITMDEAERVRALSRLVGDALERAALFEAGGDHEAAARCRGEAKGHRRDLLLVHPAAAAQDWLWSSAFCDTPEEVNRLRMMGGPGMVYHVPELSRERRISVGRGPSPAGSVVTIHTPNGNIVALRDGESLDIIPNPPR